MAKKPRVVVISQARMGSARLPGKVLMTAAGKPLLQHHLERLQRCRTADLVVLATTWLPADNPIAELCDTLGIPVFRGHPTNVLDRFARCAAVYDADVIVRVTADCPLIDPAVTDRVVSRFLAADPPLHYMSLDVTQFPRGLDTEVFAITGLIEAFTRARGAYYREHVTPYIRDQSPRLRMAVHSEPVGCGAHRWCVDEPADLALVRRILDQLLPDHPHFGWRDCLAVVSAEPAIGKLNSGVHQRAEPSAFEAYSFAQAPLLHGADTR